MCLLSWSIVGISHWIVRELLFLCDTCWLCGSRWIVMDGYMNISIHVIHKPASNSLSLTIVWWIWHLNWWKLSLAWQIIQRWSVSQLHVIEEVRPFKMKDGEKFVQSNWPGLTITPGLTNDLLREENERLQACIQQWRFRTVNYSVQSSLLTTNYIRIDVVTSPPPPL